MVEDELPGGLQAIYRESVWLDYLFKSRLSAEHKLIGVVISRSAVYNSKKALQLTLISKYSISRIVNLNQDEVQSHIDDLIRLGYLYDTGQRAGAKMIFALTFSLIPLGENKE